MRRGSLFADPKTHFTFQRIFGSVKHKPTLIGFLNDILALDDEHRVVEVTFLDPTQRPKVEELKLSIMDVKCKDARGVHYVLDLLGFVANHFEIMAVRANDESCIIIGVVMGA